MGKTISRYVLGCLVAVLAGLALCPAAGAQDVPKVTRALEQAHDAGLPRHVATQALATAYDAGFDPSAAARIIDVLADAHRRAYDLKPFQSRMEEGIAKRIDGTRIAKVLEDRLQRQVLVSSRLGKTEAEDSVAYQEAVATMADGLEMGLTPKEIDRLIRLSGDAPVAMTAVAAEMWALLKQVDFAPVLTAKIVSEGLSRRTLNAAWRHFPQIVLIARQKGFPDEATGAEALKSLEAGGVPSDLLARLGFTGRNLKTGPMLEDPAR